MEKASAYDVADRIPDMGAPPPYSAEPQGGYPNPQGVYPLEQQQGPYPPQPYQSQPQGPYQSQPQGPYQGAYPQGGYPNYHQPQLQQQTSTAMVVVSQPAMPVAAHAQPQTRPNNYLWVSIISTFFVCWLCGLVALVNSLQVNSSWERGEEAVARQKSINAKHWNIATFITAGVILLVGVPTIVFFVLVTGSTRR